jgi:hypothetical protein
MRNRLLTTLTVLTLGTAVLGLGTAPASATTLDFSFSNVIGNTPGTVTGQTLTRQSLR